MGRMARRHQSETRARCTRHGAAESRCVGMHELSRSVDCFCLVEHSRVIRFMLSWGR